MTKTQVTGTMVEGPLKGARVLVVRRFRAAFRPDVGRAVVALLEDHENGGVSWKLGQRVTVGAGQFVADERGGVVS